MQDFMTATGAADVVNVVGRAAAFLGTAIDSAIENTAAVVENAAKRADQMAFANSPKDGPARDSPRWRRHGSSPGKNARVRSNPSPKAMNKGGSRWGSGKGYGSPGGGARRSPGGKGPYRSPGGAGIRVFRSPGVASSGKKSRSRMSGEYGRVDAIPMKTGDAAGDDDWGWDAKSPTGEEKTRNVAAATAHLRRELAEVHAERDELKSAVGALNRRLKTLAEEHEMVKKQNLGLQKRMAASQYESQGGGSDPLAEQVRHQLEHLVIEKGKLAQENASLRRECESLQELLMYSNMASQVESMYSSGGLFGHAYEEGTDDDDVDDVDGVDVGGVAGEDDEAFETGAPRAEEADDTKPPPREEVAEVAVAEPPREEVAEVAVAEPPAAESEPVVEDIAADAADAAAEPEPEPEPVVATATEEEPEAPAGGKKKRGGKKGKKGKR